MVKKEMEVHLLTSFKFDNIILGLETIYDKKWLEELNLNEKKEIVEYCNKIYNSFNPAKQITEEDVEKEISITAIAINVTDHWQSKSGLIYPEISFYGDCKCDGEGICIGF